MADEELERLGKLKMIFLVAGLVLLLPCGIYAPLRDPAGGPLDYVFLVLLVLGIASLAAARWAVRQIQMRR